MAFIQDNRTIIEEIQMTGQYKGKTAYVFNLMGRRAGFTSTSAYNDIREFNASGGGATAVNTELSNNTLDIVSSSASDGGAGIGALTVKVVYINNAGALLQSGVITLNGTTPVASVLTNVNAVLWMEVFTAGSNLTAVGNIILRISGGGATTEQISAGGNKSLSAKALIPTGYTGYISNFFASSQGAEQVVRIRAAKDSLTNVVGTVYNFVDTLSISSGNVGIKEVPMIKLLQNTRIKVSTISSALAAGNKVEVSFVLILIAN